MCLVREECGQQLVEVRSFISSLGRTGDQRKETGQTGVVRYFISFVNSLSLGM